MGAQWKQKGREANSKAKAKLLSKAAKEVLIAAKAGSDPSSNARLRLAIEYAKKVNMTKDTLERVIKKGAGLLDETVTHEYKLAEVNEGYEDMRAGKNIRGVVLHDH